MALRYLNGNSICQARSKRAMHFSRDSITLLGAMEASLLARNRAFYDSIWSHARLRSPRWFGTWNLVERLTSGCETLLEIGPGARPRFPLERTVFVDLSPVALEKLKVAGARTVHASVAALPFAAGRFDAVCALDVVEHVDRPGDALREIARVLAPAGRLLLSVPLHGERWTHFDALVGHGARFELEELAMALEALGLVVDASAPFGILPRHRGLVAIGTWALEHFRGAAAWFEDRIVLPTARRTETPPQWQPTLVNAVKTDGVMLQCTKRA